MGTRRAALLLATATLALAISAGTAFAATLSGTAQSDLIFGRGGNDTLIGRAGNDTFYGGAGADRIYGDGGRDVISGSSGNDHIRADDGVRDIVDCGAGRDTVFADPMDLKVGCEIDGSKALRGGVLATFEVSAERFEVWVTNPTTMSELYGLKRGTSTATIPNGRILLGAGRASHNAPYGWHLDPEDISMADMTVEVCDARPSYVQENIWEFVGNVGRYCPWDAKLKTLRNYTGKAIKSPAPTQQPPTVSFPDEG